MAKYVYAAVFTPENDGGYSVRFPDVSGCYAEGGSLADAIKQSEDALCLMLYDIEERGEAIPVPTDIHSIQADKNELVSLVTCDTLEYRRFYDNKAVKKTLTIPNWLNNMAERSGINFSAVLQEALVNKLNIR